MADPMMITPGACYSCAHHREIPGNTHLACHHPLLEAAHKNPLAPLITATGGALPMPPPAGLHVEMHPLGVRMGWASWPFSFDPTWLVDCDGYEECP